MQNCIDINTIWMYYTVTKQRKMKERSKEGGERFTGMKARFHVAVAGRARDGGDASPNCTFPIPVNGG